MHLEALPLVQPAPICDPLANSVPQASSQLASSPRTQEPLSRALAIGVVLVCVALLASVRSGLRSHLAAAPRVQGLAATVVRLQTSQPTAIQASPGADLFVRAIAVQPKQYMSEEKAPATGLGRDVTSASTSASAAAAFVLDRDKFQMVGLLLPRNIRLALRALLQPLCLPDIYLCMLLRILCLQANCQCLVKTKLGECTNRCTGHSHTQRHEGTHTDGRGHSTHTPQHAHQHRQAP